jgi:hypothetical protein
MCFQQDFFVCSESAICDCMHEIPCFLSGINARFIQACLDPLHSVAGRPVVSGKNAVYEAVNKPSRAKFFVGMHNEMVGCCFYIEVYRFSILVV